MSALLLPFLKFAVCVALIALAGPALTRYGDVIARLTGLSRSWVGLVLVAVATSLPELFTGVTAVTAADAPNLAVGDVLGSCVFNLVMLVALDEFSRKEPMYRRIDAGHLLTAGFGVILIGAAGAFLLLGRSPLRLDAFAVGAGTPLIVVIYFVAMRAAFVYEKRRGPPPEDPGTGGGVDLRTALSRYGAAAAVVVVAGCWLPFVGQEIAAATGWKTTFVGTLLIAGATSVPEMVVTVSALRLGAVDLAIGNLLGSNLFDILILAVDDLAYRKGPLYAAAAPAQAVTAFAGVIMSGIFVVAMLTKPETRPMGTVRWASLSLLLVYVASAYVAYLLGG